MPAATVSRSTCPSSCPLLGKGGCYAEHGPLAIHWGRVDRGQVGGDFDEFIRQIERLPRRQMWRYGQAGDLPGEGDAIDRDMMIRLARANRSRPVIAYTHEPATPDNLAILDEARALSFPVRLSADNVDAADRLAAFGHNVVVIMPSAYLKQNEESQGSYRARVAEHPKHTPSGKRIAVCPATYTDTNCLSCGACAGPGCSQLRGLNKPKRGN